MELLLTVRVRTDPPSTHHFAHLLLWLLWSLLLLLLLLLLLFDAYCGAPQLLR